MDPQATLTQLKELGYFVSVRHERATPDDVEEALVVRALKVDTLAQPRTRPKYALVELDWDIAPTGGRTVVQVFRNKDDAVPLAEGVAVCAPTDNFVKHVGLTKAVGRLVGELCNVGILL